MSPRGHWAVSGGVFFCHNRGKGATGIWWAEVRDDAKCPTVQRMLFHTEHYLVQTVTSAKVRKPCSQLSQKTES